MESKMRQRLSLQAVKIDSAGQANPDISENATLLRKAKIRRLLSSTSCQNGQRTTSTFVPARSLIQIRTGNASKAWDKSTTNPATYTPCWGRGGTYPDTNFDDCIVFFLFFLGGIVCYLLSTTYHVLSSHSKTTHLFCLELDFLGILTVTGGGYPPGLWYTFPCASRRVKFTWIAVSSRPRHKPRSLIDPSQVDLAAQFLAAMLALFVKSFQAPKVRPLRGIVFSVMASSALYHLIIKIFQVGWSRADAEYSASLYALTILIYLCSVTTYAVRVFSYSLARPQVHRIEKLSLAEMPCCETAAIGRVVETGVL
ncbi:Adiponectin receptor protein [Metarhizium anisopliae]|nr:Adiponectin receptor protein [Metarhizium anisopliae]